MEKQKNANGHFFFFPKKGSPFPYGILAEENYEIVHVTFAKPLAWEQGIDAAVKYVGEQGGSAANICAIELRCPKPFTKTGFGEFNKKYLEKLASLNMLVDGQSTCARSNIAPKVSYHTDDVLLYAFSFTRSALTTSASSATAGKQPANFVLSGQVNIGGTTISEKATSVSTELKRLLKELNIDATTITNTNIYCMDGLTSELTSLSTIGSPLHGIHYHASLPPIEGLEFEIDIRCASAERWIWPSHI